MKKIIKGVLIGIIIMIFIMVIGFYFWGTSLRHPFYYFCSEDSDCIFVKSDCCGCANHGQCESINKKYKEKWDEELSKKCLDFYSCLTQPNPKYMNKKPQCFFGKCVIR